MRTSALWILILVVAAFVAAGCGGSNEGFRGSTPYTGSYAGNWSVVGSQDLGGYMTLTIADDATMRGTFTNAVSGESGRVSGGTHPDGTFTAQFILDGTGTVIDIRGNMALDGQRDMLAGDAVYTRPGGANQGMTFDLDRDQGESPLAGSFGALWSVFGTNEDGLMNVTISSQGVMIGQFGNNDTGETGVIRGVVNSQGEFTSIWTVNGTGETIEVTGSMIKTDEPLNWQGTGTWTREGEPSQGFQFDTPDEEEGGGG
jgi:predicted small secreted protein